MRKVEHHLLSKLKCPKLFFIKIEKGITSVIQVLNMLNCGLPHQDNADPQLCLIHSFEKKCPQFSGSIACTRAGFLMSGSSHTFEIWLPYPGLRV